MKQNLKRFDIILVDFRQNAIDSEQNGIRPAIIIQNDVEIYAVAQPLLCHCLVK